MLTFSRWWSLQHSFDNQMEAARLAWEDAARFTREVERTRASQIAAGFREDGKIEGSVQDAIARRILEG